MTWNSFFYLKNDNQTTILDAFNILLFFLFIVNGFVQRNYHNIFSLKCI